MSVEASFPASNRTQLRRRHERGRFDKATVYDILDSAMIAHSAYIRDGQPVCTPTGYWRQWGHAVLARGIGESDDQVAVRRAAGVRDCDPTWMRSYWRAAASTTLSTTGP